jgi:ABC-type amino acid transport substrate-binding protein
VTGGPAFALAVALALAALGQQAAHANEPAPAAAGIVAAAEPAAEDPAAIANIDPAGPPAPDLAYGPPSPKPAAPVVDPHRPGHALFYFFSPDWRPPDFSKLAFAVEQALASGNVDVSFQAFTRYEDFDRQVRAQPPTFMIAPSWLEGPEGGAAAATFTVIARPIRHGRNVYRKALMTRTNADSIDDLARASIAATLHSMGSGDPASVLGAFHLAAGTARIVPVPKDIDALLALSFGQVDAALVTSEQYEQLARTSPAEAERLRVLAFSSEVGLPPVYAAVSANPAERERLAALLVRLREVPNGADLLAMLGMGLRLGRRH